MRTLDKITERVLSKLGKPGLDRVGQPPGGWPLPPVGGRRDRLQQPRDGAGAGTVTKPATGSGTGTVTKPATGSGTGPPKPANPQDVMDGASASPGTATDGQPHLNIDDPNWKVADWDGGELNLRLPPAEEGDPCMSPCERKERMRAAKCDIVRMRVKAALYRAGCPSNVTPADDCPLPLAGEAAAAGSAGSCGCSTVNTVNATCSTSGTCCGKRKLT